MAADAATITSVILTSGTDITSNHEGIAVETITPPIDTQTYHTQPTENKRKRSSNNLGDEFCSFISLLCLLILIATPLLYLSDVETFRDSKICLNHSSYLFNLEHIFIIASFLSIFLILIIYKPNSITMKAIRFFIGLSTIPFITLLAPSSFSPFIYLLCLIIFTQLYTTKKSYTFCLSIIHHISLLSLGCISIWFAMFNVTQNTDCDERNILREIMIRCSVFYIILSIVGIWNTFNINQKIKYYLKQSLSFQSMAENDSAHIEQMEKGKFTWPMKVFLIFFGVVIMIYFMLFSWALFGPASIHGSIEDYNYIMILRNLNIV